MQPPGGLVGLLDGERAGGRAGGVDELDQMIFAGSGHRATTRDAAILKLYACEAYKQVADMGLQVLGGYGYTMEYDLQRHFRESRLGVIGAGTSDIQRNIIAKTMGL